MTILLDYSAGLLTGNAVTGAGAAGVIRYAGTPGRTKNTTPGEVASLHAAGREVHGIFENTTLDFTGGFVAGVANAKALLADASNCGITGVLFVSVDQHISGSQIGVWQQYVAGAATVLGDRLGVYGFSEAMTAVRTVARYFWQSGATPTATGTSGFVNAWQRNSGQTQMTVSGIQCDISDVLIPLGVDMPITPADATLVADAVIRALYATRVPGPDGAPRSLYDSAYQTRSDTLAISAAVKAEILAIQSAPVPVPVVPATVDVNALAAAIVVAIEPHLSTTLDDAALAAIGQAAETALRDQLNK